MATLTATKNGNWSDPTVWGGSTPVDGDTVNADSYIIDFDVDVTPPNTLLTSTTGYFRYTGAGARTVQAKADAGTHATWWIGLIVMGGAGTLTFDGPVKGGAGNNVFGAVNNGAGTLNVATATGGAGVNAHGAYNAAAGTLRCGLAVGSDWGVGGSGSYAHGVYGSGAAGQVTTVKRIQSGPYGCAAIGGAVFIEPDASNSAQFRVTPGGTTLTLVDAAAAGFPAESDVRYGVIFAGGNKTGTAHIPAAANVALGIPVDNTTGTAVLTAAAVAAAVLDAMGSTPPAVLPAPDPRGPGWAERR